MSILLNIVSSILIFSFLCLQAECIGNTSSTNSSRLPVLGPTIVEKKFVIAVDVAALQEAITANPVGNRKICDLLTNRTYNQRMNISDAYKAKYNGKVLKDALFDVTLHTLRNMIQDMLTPIDELLGSYVGGSLNMDHDWAYMSILCTSSENRLKAFNNRTYTYNKNKPKDGLSLNALIEKCLKDEEGRKVLTTLIDPNPHLRPESGINTTKAELQANLIPKSKDDCKTSNTDLLMLMTKESFDQIQAVDAAYTKAVKNASSVLDQINLFCEGDLREAYSRIVRYAVNPFRYFADELHLAFTDKNHGFIEFAAEIIGFSRCEIDLKDVEDVYKTVYGEPLLKTIADWQKYDGNYALYDVFKGNNQ